MRITEETNTVIRCLKQLDALDLGKLYGSGLDITVHSYTNPEQMHVERVTIPAELFGPVRSALIAALSETLHQRIPFLRRELAEAEEAGRHFASTKIKPPGVL